MSHEEGEQREIIDLTADDASSEMGVDSVDDYEGDSDLPFEAYERGWRRVYGRWVGEGLPGEITFARLFDLVEEAATEPSEVDLGFEFGTPRDIQGNPGRGVELLPEGSPADRDLWRASYRSNEGFGPRRLFEN